MRHEVRLTSLKNIFSAAILLVLLSGSCLLLLAAEEKDKDHFTATAAGRLGGPRGRPIQLDIRIKEYTSDSEAMRLAQMLDLQGADRVGDELEKLKRGRISTSGQSTDIAVARIRQTGGAVNESFWLQPGMFPFLGYPIQHVRAAIPLAGVELNVDEEGRGQGGVIVAAQGVVQ